MHVVSTLISFALSLAVFCGVLIVSRTKRANQELPTPRTDQQLSHQRTLARSAAYKHGKIPGKILGRILAGIVANFWRLTLAVSAVAGLVAAVIYLCWPMVNVTASGLFDENNPYSETFTVLNTAVLRSVAHVRVTIELCKIEYAANIRGTFIAARGCGNKGIQVRVGNPSWETPELAPGESFAIVLTKALTVVTDEYRRTHPDMFMGLHMMVPFTAINVIVFVDYIPWLQKLEWGPWAQWLSRQYVPFRFRFVAEEQPNHKIMWRPVPLSWQDIRLPGE
jgi:hypothetical protein